MVASNRGEVLIFLCAQREQDRRKWCAWGLGASSPYGRTAAPLSGDPPHLGPRLAWPPVVPSGGRRGCATAPSLPRGARAHFAAPIAGTPPSAVPRPVSVRRSWKHSTSHGGLGSSRAQRCLRDASPSPTLLRYRLAVLPSG